MSRPRPIDDQLGVIQRQHAQRAVQTHEIDRHLGGMVRRVSSEWIWLGGNEMERLRAKAHHLVGRVARNARPGRSGIRRSNRRTAWKNSKSAGLVVKVQYAELL